MKFSKRIARLGIPVASMGALLAAAMAPCCLPLLAALGTFSGVAAAGIAPDVGLWIMQGFGLLALAGAAANYRRQRRATPLVLTGFGTFALITGAQGWLPTWMTYIGLGALLAAAALHWWWRKEPVLLSRLTCPSCEYATKLRMPTDACLFFWDCPDCGQRAKPHEGDCCVFCSYGEIPCPPIQLSTACAC